MKVYMCTDLEGISGVVTFNDTGRDTGQAGPRYEAARLLLTEDVNAAVQGALDGGASDIIVNDGHGGGSHFVMDKLHPDARYYCGRGRVPGKNRELIEWADVLMLVGFHAMSGTANALLDHTQSSKTWHRYFVNGVETGEIGQAAIRAGHFNVPVVCVTGDSAAVEEARRFLGDIETVAVKEGCSRQSAICLAPVKARQLIQTAAKRAMGLADKIKPYKIEVPAEIRLECAGSDYADSLEASGRWERVDGFTVRRQAATALDI